MNKSKVLTGTMSFFSALSVLFTIQLVFSCKTSDVLPGRVPYREFVDSARKVSNAHAVFTIPNKRKYLADGGMTYDDLRARMVLARTFGSKSFLEEQEKRHKTALSYWVDHAIDVGGYTAEYMLSDDEKLKVFTWFYNGRKMEPAVFRVDSADVEKGRKKIPVQVSAAHFTMMRNPPLNYVFTCNIKYGKKWYSLYHHVDIEKNPTFDGHETQCERLR